MNFLNTCKYLMIFWVPPILWVGFTFYLSSLPAKEIPEINFPFFDKLVHFGIYLIMSVLFFRAFLSLAYWRYFHAVLGAFILCAGYAALDEYHQLFSDGRYMDWNDWFADVLGIVAGLLLYRIVIRRVKG